MWWFYPTAANWRSLWPYISFSLSLSLFYIACVLFGKQISQIWEMWGFSITVIFKLQLTQMKPFTDYIFLTSQLEQTQDCSSCGPLESSYKMLIPPASQGTGCYLQHRHTCMHSTKHFMSLCCFVKWQNITYCNPWDVMTWRTKAQLWLETLPREKISQSRMP